MSLCVRAVFHKSSPPGNAHNLVKSVVELAYGDKLEEADHEFEYGIVEHSLLVQELREKGSLELHVQRVPFRLELKETEDQPFDDPYSNLFRFEAVFLDKKPPVAADKVLQALDTCLDVQATKCGDDDVYGCSLTGAAVISSAGEMMVAGRKYLPSFFEQIRVSFESYEFESIQAAGRFMQFIQKTFGIRMFLLPGRDPNVFQVRQEDLQSLLLISADKLDHFGKKFSFISCGIPKIVRANVTTKLSISTIAPLIANIVALTLNIEIQSISEEEPLRFAVPNKVLFDNLISSHIKVHGEDVVFGPDKADEISHIPDAAMTMMMMMPMVSTPSPPQGFRPSTLKIFQDAENCTIPFKYTVDASTLYNLVVESSLSAACIDAPEAHSVSVDWNFVYRLQTPEAFLPNPGVTKSLQQKGINFVISGGKQGASDNKIKELLGKLDDPSLAKNLVLVVLITGDSDFTQDVMKLQKQGFRVVLFVNENAAKALKTCVPEKMCLNWVDTLKKSQPISPSAAAVAVPVPVPVVPVPSPVASVSSGSSSLSANSAPAIPVSAIFLSNNDEAIPDKSSNLCPSSSTLRFPISYQQWLYFIKCKGTLEHEMRNKFAVRFEFDVDFDSNKFSIAISEVDEASLVSIPSPLSFNSTTVPGCSVGLASDFINRLIRSTSTSKPFATSVNPEKLLQIYGNPEVLIVRKNYVCITCKGLPVDWSDEHLSTWMKEIHKIDVVAAYVGGGYRKGWFVLPAMTVDRWQEVMANQKRIQESGVAPLCDIKFSFEKREGESGGLSISPPTSMTGPPTTVAPASLPPLPSFAAASIQEDVEAALKATPVYQIVFPKELKDLTEVIRARIGELEVTSQLWEMKDWDKLSWFRETMPELKKKLENLRVQSTNTKNDGTLDKTTEGRRSSPSYRGAGPALPTSRTLPAALVLKLHGCVINVQNAVVFLETTLSSIYGVTDKCNLDPKIPIKSLVSFFNKISSMGSQYNNRFHLKVNDGSKSTNIDTSSQPMPSTVPPPSSLLSLSSPDAARTLKINIAGPIEAKVKAQLRQIKEYSELRMECIEIPLISKPNLLACLKDKNTFLGLYELVDAFTDPGEKTVTLVGKEEDINIVSEMVKAEFRWSCMVLTDDNDVILDRISDLVQLPRNKNFFETELRVSTPFSLQIPFRMYTSSADDERGFNCIGRLRGPTGMLPSTAAELKQRLKQLYHDHFGVHPLEKQQHVLYGLSESAMQVRDALEPLGVCLKISNFANPCVFSVADWMQITVKECPWQQVGTEAVVIPTNPHLSYGAGLSKSVITEFGEGFSRQLEQIVKEGPLNIGTAVSTMVPNSSSPLCCIIHAVCPSAADGNFDRLLMKALFDSMDEANRQVVSSIAIPGLGAGHNRLTHARSASLIVHCIREWATCRGATTLRNIVLFDISPEMVGSFCSELIAVVAGDSTTGAAQETSSSSSSLIPIIAPRPHSHSSSLSLVSAPFPAPITQITSSSLSPTASPFSSRHNSPVRPQDMAVSISTTSTAPGSALSSFSSLSSAASAASTVVNTPYIAKWYWKSDNNQFVPYQNNLCMLLEEAYSSGQKSILINPGRRDGPMYEVNFANMMQYHMVTRYARQVKRELEPNPVAYPTLGIWRRPSGPVLLASIKQIRVIPLTAALYGPKATLATAEVIVNDFLQQKQRVMTLDIPNSLIDDEDRVRQMLTVRGEVVIQGWDRVQKKVRLEAYSDFVAACTTARLFDIAMQEYGYN